MLLADRLDVDGTDARNSSLRRRLLGWYRRQGRSLPWRAARDPYRIWVSEVMLQQTQVATALEYYQRFVRRFPTVASLARARESDVLASWSGLGYYRRARHLHAAAQSVVREHAGRIPDDAEQFGSLPGVGRYTTGAVLSIAFGRPLPVLDGNVARVLSRLWALPASVRDPRGARALWGLAEALVPKTKPGDWNQALMELGALVCTPRSPLCGSCPVASHCEALAHGQVDRFPPVAPRPRTVRLRWALAWIERRGRVLVTQRSGALLGGLWEPPVAELAGPADPAHAGSRLRDVLQALGVHAKLEPSGAIVRHRITHRAIEVEVWRGALAGPLPRRADLRFVDPEDREVALTGLARKAARLRL